MATVSKSIAFSCSIIWGRVQTLLWILQLCSWQSKAHLSELLPQNSFPAGKVEDSAFTAWQRGYSWNTKKYSILALNFS